MSPDIADDRSAAHRWSDLLTSLIAGQNLTGDDTGWAMDQIMSGEASPVRVAGFLVALRAKGETVEELTALADTMLAYAIRLDVPGRAVDIVGTGGDRAHTVNISTMAALVIAGAGVRVVKHGSRASSSSSGSADVLEALGLRLDHTPARVAQIGERAGITFCFAGTFHSSMRHAAVARRDLAVATAFNFLGPLTNPAQPAAAAIGCADTRMAGLMAGVLAGRGADALVFRNDDGLDELAPTGTSRVWAVSGGTVTDHVLDPVADLGLAPVEVAELRGADAQFNAGVARTIFAARPHPARETVLLNAASALVAEGSLPGTGDGSLVDRLAAGLRHAEESIDSGAAEAVLARWREASAD